MYIFVWRHWDESLSIQLIIITSKNIRFIEYNNIHPRIHLNRSKLYFNFHGNSLFVNNICKYLECWHCFNEKEGNVNAKTTNDPNEKYDYCSLKDIETSSNILANYNASNKDDIENINSKNLEFCSDNEITNKAHIKKVMDENLCKIHQESEESKSREVTYSSEDISSLFRDISKKNMNKIKIG